ncbi:MAG: type II secretion system protein GspM, partial [Rhodospirillaceae bacterium]|nr:type II secretion system protein GspM [Rhodospirillaceae bacterium]
MVSQVSTWWQARTARERRLAAGTAILVLAFGAYQAVLRPVWDARSRAAAELEVAHAYLDQVNADVRAVHDLARRAGAVEPLDAGGLRTTASAVAVSAGVEILRLQPLDGGV